MIEFRDGNYVSRLFMLGCEGMDVMGCLSRPKGSKTFQILFRYRRHVDDKTWDSDDTKNWRRKVGILSEEAGIKDIESLIKGFRMTTVALDRGEPTIDIVVVESEDAEVAMAKMRERPWCSVRRIDVDDN